MASRILLFTIILLCVVAASIAQNSTGPTPLAQPPTAEESDNTINGHQYETTPGTIQKTTGWTVEQPSTTTTTTTTAMYITPFGFPVESGTESPDEVFADQCSKPALISNFCILPDELKKFLHPNATLQDVGKYLISDTLIQNLQEECPPGTWCLNSDASELVLDEQVQFWTNATDFNMLCWPDIAVCLDYISDFFFDCDFYETYHLITNMDTLLCKMKAEPKASTDCIRQTLKVLHISVADSKRTFKQLESSEEEPTCKSRRSKMTQNFLCTTALCDKYSAMLYEFEPWAWLTDTIDDLKKECSLEDIDCVKMAEQDVLTNLLSAVILDEEKVIEKNWALEQMGMRSGIIIVLVSVAAIGAISLVVFVMWRKRKMRVRVRDGMEYLEIKPEETEAFMEGMDEIGDSCKLINQ